MMSWYGNEQSDWFSLDQDKEISQRENRSTCKYEDLQVPEYANMISLYAEMQI